MKLGPFLLSPLLLLSLISTSYASVATPEEPFALVSAEPNTDSTEAPADAPVPEKLVLMGRGFIRKKSEERLVLACVNADCTQFRFVYFPDTTHAQWLGPVLEKKIISQDADLQEKYEKLKMQDFLLHHEDDTGQINTYNNYGKVAGPAIAVGGSCLLNALHITSAVVAVSSMIGVGLALFFIAIEVGYLIASADNDLIGQNYENQIYTSTHNQNGWNWSVNPTRLKRSKFDTLVNSIQLQTVNRSDRTQRKIDRIEKKIKKLEAPVATQPIS